MDSLLRMFSVGQYHEHAIMSGIVVLPRLRNRGPWLTRNRLACMEQIGVDRGVDNQIPTPERALCYAYTGKSKAEHGINGLLRTTASICVVVHWWAAQTAALLCQSLVALGLDRRWTG